MIVGIYIGKSGNIAPRQPVGLRPLSKRGPCFGPTFAKAELTAGADKQFRSADAGIEIPLPLLVSCSTLLHRAFIESAVKLSKAGSRWTNFPKVNSFMKPLLRRTSALLSTLILAVAIFLPGHAAERDSLKVFTIGNSFSNDALALLPSIAEAGGKKLVVGRASIGGSSLERHASHLQEAESGDPKGKAYRVNDPKTGATATYTLPELLASQAWDVVTIQQWSELSFKPETFQPFADQLITAIHKYAPNAEIVVHETWAYREDHPWFKRNDGFTPTKMYEGARDTYKNFADGKGLRILPVGDAMNLARQTPRWTYVHDVNYDFKKPPAGELPDQRTSLNVGWKWKNNAGQPALNLDAIHCNTAGRYLAASVWYLQLFNTDTLPSDYLPNGLTAEDAADLRIHALAAIKTERARVAAPAKEVVIISSFDSHCKGLRLDAIAKANIYKVPNKEFSAPGVPEINLYNSANLSAAPFSSDHPKTK